jgi:hypothetical protein
MGEENKANKNKDLITVLQWAQVGSLERYKCAQNMLQLALQGTIATGGERV